MKIERLIEMGFKPIPHFTVTNSHTYDLGRRRTLSVASPNSANEMLFICESDFRDDKRTNDLICIHNFDFDGVLEEDKLKAIIDALLM